MVVGYKTASHNYKRNIIGILHEVEYKKTRDLFSLINSFARYTSHITRKKRIFRNLNFAYKFNDFNFNKVNILHFFNTINFGRTPWITTFETVLPKFNCVSTCHHGSEPSFSGLEGDGKIHKALAAISGDSCKRIIAMSNCNADMQREFLKNFPEYNESIGRKLTVMHPPQRSLVSDCSDKDLNFEGKIKFMFVGRSFFRKGGFEITETLKRLKEQHKYEIELTIVSSLSIDNYATNEGPDDVSEASHFIQKNYDWINYFPELSNREVLELMQKSHVGLLPTYAETYGYSVLEFQASGCPVITTNVRALPEINDNNSGWLIEVPKNYLGEAVYTTKEDRVVISKLIRNGLEQAVHEIFSDRTVVPNKSKNAISRIKAKHSISSYAEGMSEIYFSAIKDTCRS